MVPGAGASTAERAQVTTVAPASTSTCGDARADALAAARDEGDTVGEVHGERHPCRLPSKCLVVDWLTEKDRMGVTSELHDDGVRVITMDFPPVNALPVQGWFDLAAALDEASRDLATHVVVLRAEGKGFNAGVDIKEMQNTEGFDALIGANRGCFAAFQAVYECACR